MQKDNPGIAVIGIEDDESAVQQARELAKQNAISYTLVLPNSFTRKAFGSVPGLPTSLYISRSGRVIHSVNGVVPESVMRYYLKDAVAAR